VPYIVRWPGHVPAGTVSDETVSLVDTLASVAAVIGQKMPPANNAAEDSYDVSPAWLGATYKSPLRRDLIVHSADGNFAIRQGRWKWIEGIPADDVKPAARKARAEQFHRMLFDLQSDLAESSDISTANEETVAQLESLLTRYRDGGYSRELPPVGTKPQPREAALPPLQGTKLLDLPFTELPSRPWSTTGGEGTAHDGAVWTKAGDRGSSLSGPVQFQDGVIEFQVRLGDADRHSLRIHTAENEHSYRIVLSRGNIDISRNPPRGEAAAKAVSLGRQRLRFDPHEWQTLRLTFNGDELTVQVAGVTTKANDPVIAETKSRLFFIAFDGEVGLRKLVVMTP